MVTRNHFVIPATVLEKFRSRGFPEGVTLTADHCSMYLVITIEISQWLLLTILTRKPTTPLPSLSSHIPRPNSDFALANGYPNLKCEFGRRAASGKISPFFLFFFLPGPGKVAMAMA